LILLSFILFSNTTRVLFEGTGFIRALSLYCRAEVILTDLSQHLSLLEKNVDLNHQAFPASVAKPRVQELRWGEEDNLQGLENVNLVLVSDCIYYEASLTPLVNTLRHLITGETTALISFEERETKKEVEEKFLALVKSSFEVNEFVESECHPDYASPDIRVLQLKPKKEA